MRRASAAVSNDAFGNRQELQMLSFKLPFLLAKFKMCGVVLSVLVNVLK